MEYRFKICLFAIILSVIILLSGMHASSWALMPIKQGIGVETEQIIPEEEGPVDEPETGGEAREEVKRETSPAPRDNMPFEGGIETRHEGIRQIREEKRRILDSVDLEKRYERRRPFETDRTIEESRIISHPKVEEEIEYLKIANKRLTRYVLLFLALVVALYFLSRLLIPNK